MTPTGPRLTLPEFSLPDPVGVLSARVGAAGSERPSEVGVAERRGVPFAAACKIGAGLRCERKDANFDRPSQHTVWCQGHDVGGSAIDLCYAGIDL